MERASGIVDKREWPFLLGLGLMGLVIFFYRLGVPGLMDPDEGRYAEIAREFFVSGDWLIPHLNLVPYLEKPPLVYWLTALSFGGLGYSEFAARLPAALSALGGILLAYGLGRAMWGPGPAFFSALILATCGGYVALGRVLTLDMTLALFLNLGVGLGYLALSRPRPSIWPWAYLALGLGVLTKGPVALVLAGLIWGIWVLVHPHPNPPPSRGREQKDSSLHPSPPPSRGREQKEGTSSPPPQPSPLKGEGVKGSAYLRLGLLYQPRSWLLLGVISLPWFAWVIWRYPEFGRFFFLEQHFGRYLTAASHPQPFYYYGPVLLGLMLPWSWLLPWALAKGRGAGQDRVFLLLWAGVILVFFSLSRGKLAPYILPALLPLALLLGKGLYGFKEAGLRFFQDRGLTICLWAWAAVGWGLVALYFRPPELLAPQLARAAIYGPCVPWSLVVLALTPTVALICRNLGVLFLGALVLSTLLPLSLERLSAQRSPRQAGRVVKSLWQPGAALVGVHLYSQGLSFYSGQVFHLLSFRTELDFGRKLKPDSGFFFSSLAEMAAFARSRPVVFFFLRAQDLPGFEQWLPGKYRSLARYKDCILVTYEGK
ncbi:MAG: glycosyltransferase family 39 protein [Desulfobaccales bacterium]|nr:glycosyltransferase family 39 protein [Desulfobaccales bacterium]